MGILSEILNDMQSQHSIFKAILLQFQENFEIYKLVVKLLRSRIN